MLISLELNVAPLLGLARHLTGPEIARRASLALEETAAKIAADAATDAPRDTGLLAASITYDTWGTSNTIWGRVYTPLRYGIAMEYGVPPGSPPPAPGELLGWMSRHGFPPEAEGALRWSIHKKGIVPQPYMRPALEANKQYFVQALTRHLFGSLPISTRI